MTADFRVGPWLVAPSLNIISRNGTIAHLEPKVMQVLVCLAEHAGETVPKEKLLQVVWPNTFVSDDALKHCVSELRRAFEDDAREPRVIQTIAKRGYRLVAPVEPVNEVKESSTLVTSAPVLKMMGSNPRKRWAGVAVSTAILLSVLLVAIQRIRTANANGLLSIHSLAVLPLENLSADPAQEYFSDGMTDALITNLAQINSLKVISRTSIVRYKKTEKSLPEIARELGVQGIVEGTVQRSGDRVRITAQLILGPADKHLWAASYERDLRDVFLLEEDVAGDIARQVRTRLTNRAQLTHRQPVSAAALEAYLQGNSHMRKSGRGSGDEELILASKYFQQAIDAEPDFVPAYVALYKARSDTFRSSDEDVEMSIKAVERAVEIDPNLSDGWAAMGDIRRDSFDWAGAEEDYRRALALNPNDAVAHEHLSWLLDALGRLDEGWKEAELAQQLDPNQEHLEPALCNRHEYDQVIQHTMTMLQADPDNDVLHYNLYDGYAGKGMYKEAVQELEQTAALAGHPEIADRLREAYEASGYRGAMRQLAGEFERLHATNEVFMPINTADFYVAAGDNDRAFYWLEQAYRRRGHGHGGIPTVFLNREPGLEPLHSDPRYKDLLRRVGLPP